MAAFGWLMALIAAVGALALPFSRGSAFVLAITPLANAYGAAAAIGLVLVRWAVFELPTKSIPREVWPKVLLATGFLAGALVLSFLVADDLIRLASESVQWIVGVGWFCALLIGGREAHERPVILGLMTGGVILAFAHVVMRLLDISVDEFAVLPFMISHGNNYAALYALVALVVLPMHPAVRLSTPAYLFIAALGILVAALHDSRAQMLLGAGTVGVVLLLRYLRPGTAILLVAVSLAATLALALNFMSESMFSASSLASVANFQTNYSNLERLGLILHSIDFFQANPFGAGLGASSEVFPDSPYTIGSYPTPHNTFAMMIVEIGWWGLVAYVIGVVALLRIGIRTCLAGNPFGMAALSAIALSIVDAVFFNGSLSLLFWLLLAFSVRSAPDEKRERIPMLFSRGV
jgi:hypothetical protein